MRTLTLLLISLFLLSQGGLTQGRFNAFRALETRVKHTYPDSLYVFSKALDTSDVAGKVLYHWSRGKAFFWQSDYPRAYFQLEKAARWIKELNQPVWRAEIFLDLSSSLSAVDRDGKALSFLLEANAIADSSRNMDQYLEAKISLGEMYRKIQDFDKAMKTLQNVRKHTTRYTFHRARCLNRIAAVFSETDQLDSSLHYSMQSLELAESINHADLIATAENEIGYVYRVQRKLRKSLPHFQRADSLWRSVGMLRYAVNAMHHISVVYGTIGELEKSLAVTHKALELIEGKKWYQLEVNLLEDLRNLQGQLNRPDSMEYYEHKRLRTVISKKDQDYEVNTRMVEVLFSQKQNEQTIREQTMLLKNKELEQAAISRERTFLLITLVFIVVILLVIFIYAYKQRKLRLRLREENEEKELKNAQLIEVSQANEALVQEISHRVKNNLAVLSGLLSMQAVRSENDIVSKELTDSILRIDSIATIHKKLYDKRTDAKVDLQEALIELTENVLTAMGHDPKASLDKSIDPCEIDIASAVPFCLIINEVITNSCKYGEVSIDKKLRVQLRNVEGEISCFVMDKGDGFDPDNVADNSKSLGLHLIKLLAKQLNAVVSWKKSPDYFTFKIELRKDESVL